VGPISLVRHTSAGNVDSQRDLVVEGWRAAPPRDRRDHETFVGDLDGPQFGGLHYAVAAQGHGPVFDAMPKFGVQTVTQLTGAESGAAHSLLV
jgi:hypothetical protein